MDYSEATKMVFERIEELEPQNVSRIIGFILLQNRGELEMLRLVFAPDHVLKALIDEAKQGLGLSPQPTSKKPVVISELPTKFTPFVPASSCVPSSSAPFRPGKGVLIPQISNGQQIYQSYQYFPAPYLFNRPHLLLGDQTGIGNLDGPIYPAYNYCPELVFNPKPEHWSPDYCHYFAELSIPVCDSFRQGYCKYGGSCKYLHVVRMANGHLMVLNPPNTDEMSVSDYVLSRGSIKQLEMELVELLKSRRGIPVSISSLPILYFDKYGRVLQVEGYLLENHRQGKFTCKMTQLLAQMTNTIRVIDRSHGRQSIVLAEDVDKVYSGGGNGHESQVYLTFLPQSMFSEKDVETYFNNFGPVKEVRIPHQAKRMFGFVAFVFPETVALVLTKSNPHYICGEQVLVKPYQMKSMLVDRKTEQKAPQQIDADPEFPDAEPKLPSTPRLYEDMQLLEKQLIEEYEPNRTATDHSFFSSKSDASNPPNDQSQLTNYSEEVVANHIEASKNAPESSRELNLDLPDSAFASALARGLGNYTLLKK